MRDEGVRDEGVRDEGVREHRTLNIEHRTFD